MESDKVKFVVLMLICMPSVTHAWGWPWPWSPWWQPPPRGGWPQPPPPTPPRSSPPQTPAPPPPRHPQPPLAPPPKSLPPSGPPRQPPPTPGASQDPADCQDALIYVDVCIRDLITFFFEKDGSSVGQNCCAAISELSDDCFSKAFAGFSDPEFIKRVRDYCGSQFHV